MTNPRRRRRLRTQASAQTPVRQSTTTAQAIIQDRCDDNEAVARSKGKNAQNR